MTKPKPKKRKPKFSDFYTYDPAERLWIVSVLSKSFVVRGSRAQAVKYGKAYILCAKYVPGGLPKDIAYIWREYGSVKRAAVLEGGP